MHFMINLRKNAEKARNVPRCINASSLLKFGAKNKRCIEELIGKASKIPCIKNANKLLIILV